MIDVVDMRARLEGLERFTDWKGERGPLTSRSPQVFVASGLQAPRWATGGGNEQVLLCRTAERWTRWRHEE